MNLGAPGGGFGFAAAGSVVTGSGVAAVVAGALLAGGAGAVSGSSPAPQPVATSAATSGTASNRDTPPPYSGAPAASLKFSFQVSLEKATATWAASAAFSTMRFLFTSTVRPPLRS